MNDGWKVLAEWGTVNRFNVSTINSHSDFLANGWFVASDAVQATTFNTGSYDTDPQVTQWFRGGSPMAAYEHYIPVGTTQVVVAFTASSHRCNAYIFDHAGAQVYNRSRTGEGFSPLPNPDIVEVDTTAGPAKIRFEETQICWTAYAV